MGNHLLITDSCGNTIFEGEYVEIHTPHGRLIDADYLKKDRINISGTDFVLLVDVDNAKTIIEAEVGKQ